MHAKYVIVFWKVESKQLKREQKIYNIARCL